MAVVIGKGLRIGTASVSVGVGQGLRVGPAIGMGASAYLGQVATKTWVPNETNTSNKQLMARSPHFARDDITSLQILLPNWYWDRQGTRTEKGSGGSITYTASIEYPAGTFTQVKFSEAASGIAANGGNLLSDAVLVSIPAGALFWVRTFQSSAVGIIFHGSFIVGSNNMSLRDTVNGGEMAYAASGLSDQTMGGTITSNPGSPSPFFTPLAIIAQTQKPSVFIMGDSIAWGAFDLFDASGDLGSVARSIGGNLAYINAGCYGDEASLAKANYSKRAALIQYCSHVVCELGINDLSAGAGNKSAATLKSDLGVLYGFAGGKPVYQTTITPRSSSSNSWATTAGQTLDANAAQFTAFNDDVRTTPAPLTGYFDISDAVSSARNSNFWKVTGVSFGYTTDGTHPNQAANLLIKDSGVLNPAVFAR